MYVLELVFDTSAAEQRLAARPAHRERLAKLLAEKRLRLAGPWPDDSGALLLFDTDEEGMQEILAADPYYSTPGVSVAVLREWNPVAGV
jgi:uncharacterized protein YciI